MDLRGATDYLTSPVSQKVESWTHYNEWGEITHNAVVKCGQREFDMVKRYATHDYDQVLGMFYAKARFYDAGDRRFVSVDPIKGHIAEPMTMVQYLYVVNNPLILIDLLGLNPTNELLFINMDQTRTKPVKVGSRTIQYISLVDVLDQLSTAETYINYNAANNTAIYEVSHGGKTLQFSITDGIGTINSKSQGINNHHFNPKLIDGTNYINAATLSEYFSLLWCEKYYIDGLSTAEGRTIIGLLDIAMSNASLFEMRGAEVDALREARNFLITGIATPSSYKVLVDIEIKSSVLRKQQELSAERFVRVIDNIVTIGALATGHPYVAALSNLVTAGATNDPLGALLSGAGIIPGNIGKVFTAIGGASSGYGTYNSVTKDIDSPENIDIEIYLKSDRYNRLVFEITPEGQLVDAFYVISDDYKLGYEYQPYKGEVPPDLKFKFFNKGGGFIVYPYEYE